MTNLQKFTTAVFRLESFIFKTVYLDLLQLSTYYNDSKHNKKFLFHSCKYSLEKSLTT